jgi:plasmid stabilization system protein ParE
MRRAFKRPQFLLDLTEELTWLRDKAGTEVAAPWHESVRDTIRTLEQHPFLGRPRNDLSPPGLRSWRVSGFPRWLIFYTVDEQDCVVLFRLRQGTMNLVVLKMES